MFIYMLVRGHNSTLYVGSWAKFYAKNDCDEFATKIATELYTQICTHNSYNNFVVFKKRFVEMLC